MPDARASGDLRALSIAQREQTKEHMRKIVAANLPKTSARIEFHDSYPPMTPNDGNKKLLALYDAVSRDLGHGPCDGGESASARARRISHSLPIMSRWRSTVLVVGRQCAHAR